MDHDLAGIEQYREDEHYRPDDADWAHEMREPEPEQDEADGVGVEDERLAREQLIADGIMPPDVREAIANGVWEEA
jgi:hypothetical protein